jgi:hypothetical protein
MIKASDIRIGNFIVDDDGALSKVVGFKPYEHSVRCDEEEGCDILIDIHGADGKIRSGYAVASTDSNFIPLTTEWLVRCGFVYKDGASDYGYERKNGVHLYEHDEESGLFHFSRGHMEGSKVEIKYLHQLQNIYFALTGEELQIKMS